MIRTMLTTTAIAALLGTAVIAQDAPANNAMEPMNEMATENTMATDNAMEPANDMATDNAMEPANDMATDNAMEPATAAPAATTTAAPAATDMADEAPFDINSGYTPAATDFRASDLMGAGVWSSAGDDAEEIGTINEMVLNEDGHIQAVVVGIGGFLGIGEREVAIDFVALEWTVAADGSERWVYPTTAEALENVPEFVWADEAVTDPAMAPADPAMAPAADPAAPAPVTN